MIGHQDTEIIDDGKVFVIDKDTKEISGEMLIISQFMNKSERVTLKMPRYIEGQVCMYCPLLISLYIVFLQNPICSAIQATFIPACK